MLKQRMEMLKKRREAKGDSGGTTKGSSSALKIPVKKRTGGAVAT
jgi:hypothetical protein